MTHIAKQDGKFGYQIFLEKDYETFVVKSWHNRKRKGFILSKEARVICCVKCPNCGRLNYFFPANVYSCWNCRVAFFVGGEDFLNQVKETGNCDIVSGYANMKELTTRGNVSKED